MKKRILHIISSLNWRGGEQQVDYLFNRSSDSYINNVDGQDYFIFHDGEDKLCFVLCDGVGQSYCGQLAAKFLGDYLFN